MCGLRGRNDLLDIKNLGVNAIRSYEYKGYYNHVPFLNYAQTLGLKVLPGPVLNCYYEQWLALIPLCAMQVIVPLSNSEILAGSPSGGYIATTINEVGHLHACVRNPESKDLHDDQHTITTHSIL